MIRRAIQVGWALALAVSACGYAHAQPRIEVRSKTTLRLSATADRRHLQITGVLVDDRGDRLGRRHINVAITTTDDGARIQELLTATTDAVGEFSTSRDVNEARHWNVRATYTGDPHTDTTDTVVSVGPRKTAVTLAIEEPTSRRIDLDQAQLILVVRASAVGSLFGHAIALRDEAGHPIATGLIDERGRWQATIRTAELGEPGPGRLVVSCAEDASHAAAEIALDILRFRSSNVTLAVSVGARPLAVTGQVTDARAQPLPQQTVTLTAVGERLATVLTDSRGTFFVGRSERWPRSEAVRLVALHESGTPWWVGGQSPPLTVSLPTPWRPAWWLLALAATVSAVLLAGAARASQPRRLRRNARQQKALATDVDLGIADAQAGPMDSVQAYVVDAMTLQPVAGVTVACVLPTGDVSATATVDGAFELHHLPVGRWPLRVSAPGYTETNATVTIPQRGQWTGARIRLQSRRHTVLGHYHRGLLAWLRKHDAITRLTAREALALSEQHPPGTSRTAFQALTIRFEATYYAAAAPTPEAVKQVGDYADEVENAIRETGQESFDAPRGRSL